MNRPRLTADERKLLEELIEPVSVNPIVPSQSAIGRRVRELELTGHDDTPAFPRISALNSYDAVLQDVECEQSLSRPEKAVLTG